MATQDDGSIRLSLELDENEIRRIEDQLLQIFDEQKLSKFRNELDLLFRERTGLLKSQQELNKALEAYREVLLSVSQQEERREEVAAKLRAVDQTIAKVQRDIAASIKEQTRAQAQLQAQEQARLQEQQQMYAALWEEMEAEAKRRAEYEQAYTQLLIDQDKQRIRDQIAASQERRDAIKRDGSALSQLVKAEQRITQEQQKQAALEAARAAEQSRVLALRRKYWQEERHNAQKYNQELDRAHVKTTLASTNVLRIVQDAQYGMMGMANNIEQLGESTAMLVAQYRKMGMRTLPALGAAFKAAFLPLVAGPMAIATLVTLTVALTTNFDKLANVYDKIRVKLGLLSRAQARYNELRREQNEIDRKSKNFVYLSEAIDEIEDEDLYAARQAFQDEKDRLEAIRGESNDTRQQQFDALVKSMSRAEKMEYYQAHKLYKRTRRVPEHLSAKVKQAFDIGRARGAQGIAIDQELERVTVALAELDLRIKEFEAKNKDRLLVARLLGIKVEENEPKDTDTKNWEDYFQNFTLALDAFEASAMPTLTPLQKYLREVEQIQVKMAKLNQDALELQKEGRITEEQYTAFVERIGTIGFEAQMSARRAFQEQTLEDFQREQNRRISESRRRREAAIRTARYQSTTVAMSDAARASMFGGNPFQKEYNDIARRRKEGFAAIDADRADVIFERDTLQEQYDAGMYASPEEGEQMLKQIQAYNDRLAALKDQEQAIHRETAEAVIELNRKQRDAVLGNAQQTLSTLGGIMGDIGALFGDSSKKALKKQQEMLYAQAVMDAIAAEIAVVRSIIATPDPGPWKIALAVAQGVAVFTQLMARAKQIHNMKPGGSGPSATPQGKYTSLNSAITGDRVIDYERQRGRRDSERTTLQDRALLSMSENLKKLQAGLSDLKVTIDDPTSAEVYKRGQKRVQKIEGTA